MCAGSNYISKTINFLHISPAERSQATKKMKGCIQKWYTYEKDRIQGAAVSMAS